jgi:hypothetical protein
MKLASGLTKWCAITTALMHATSCGTVVSDSAVCAGTAQATTDHAAALAADGGNRSVVTGAFLIKQLDAGCGR